MTTLINKSEIINWLSGRYTNIKPFVLNDHIKKDQEFRVHTVFQIRGVSFQVATYEIDNDIFQRVLIIGGKQIFNF